MVSVLDSGAEGPGFKSQLRRCGVTVSGKLFTPIVPLFTKQRNWLRVTGYPSNLLRVARVTAGLAESNGSLPPGFMTRVTSGLTAKNRDQLRNTALGNRVWANFFYPTLNYRATCLLSASRDENGQVDVWR